MPTNTRANDLEQRLIQFATNIVKLSVQLKDSPEARHIASQVLRSGTAAAPNYAEARSAESRPDFIHKLKVALKELNETRRGCESFREVSLKSRTFCPA
jgi:four helix bundle protein